MLSFRQWFILDEGSYTEADIPPYFYLACYFSEDLVSKKSYTPDGATCTLVGVEGISSSPNTMGKFFSGVGLQMPGKAFTQLNKVSMVGYDNLDYLTSAGFRTPRRLKGGRQSQNYLYYSLIFNFLSLIETRFSDVYKAINEKYSDKSALVDILKKVPGNPWGSRKQEVDVEGPPEKPGEKHTKLVGKNIKPERHRHIENNLKNISNINDLANRLMTLFKDIPGIKELLKPSKDEEENGKPISWIKYYLKTAVKNIFSTHHSEKEWVLKRQAIGRMGKKCPHCNAFNIIKNEQIGKSVQCIDCSEEFIAYLPFEREIAHKSVINVPEGSIMYLGRTPTDTLKPWARKIIEAHEKATNSTIPSSDTMRFLADKFKLYQHFEVHFVNDSDEAVQYGKGERTDNPAYDPEKKEFQEKMIQAVKRGINRVDTLQKWLEKKERISPSKFKAFLDRWQKLGIIKVENNIITVLDASFDEDRGLVLRAIQNADDGLSASDIKAKLRIDPTEILAKLNKENKIYKKGDDWFVKYTDEDIRNLSSLDHEILATLKDPNNEYDFTHDFPGPFEKNEIKKATRILKHKGLIFKGQFSEVMLSVEDAFTEEQAKLLAYLKKYPVSDVQTIDKIKNIDNHKKALDYLAKKGLITTNGDDILLDTSKTPADPDASKYPKGYQEIMDIINNHFVTETNVITDILKKDYYDFKDMIYAMMNKNIITRGGRERLITKESKPVEETVEFKKILELLGEKHLTAAQLAQQMPSNSYDATVELLGILEEDDKVKSTINTVENKTYWHLSHQTHETDYKPYMDAVLKAFKGTPLSLSQIYQEYSELSYAGLRSVLNKMCELGMLEASANFVQEPVWLLFGGEKPISKEVVQKMITDYLTENGPQPRTNLSRHFAEKLGVSTDSINDFVSDLKVSKIVQADYDEVEEDYVVNLPGQINTAQEELKEKLIKIISEHPGNPYKIAELYNQTDDKYLGPTKIEFYLTKCVEDKKLVQSMDLNGDWIYHIPEYNYAKIIEDKILVYLDKKGGQALLSDFSELGSIIFIRKYVMSMAEDHKLYTASSLPQSLMQGHGSNSASLLVSKVPISEDHPLFVKRLLAFLESIPGHQATATKMSAYFKSISPTGMTIYLVKDLILEMVNQKLIHMINPETFHWGSILQLGPPPAVFQSDKELVNQLTK